MTAPILALVQSPRYRGALQVLATQLQTELIEGVEVAGAVRRVAEVRPLILLVEITLDSSTWGEILRALRTNNATRRLGIIGFAENLPTTEYDGLFDERLALPPDQLAPALVDLIPRYGRRSDTDIQAALVSPCQQPMPELVYAGIQRFNAGDYYDAHEELELAWRAEDGVIRNLYQGILQVGVAYHHIQLRNYWGAIKMFLRAFQWLEAMPDECHGIQVGKLRSDARHIWQTLEALGADRIGEFDLVFQPVVFDSTFIPKEHR